MTTYNTTRPSLGRYGTFGFGRQTDPNTPVVPNRFLRYNGGSSMIANTVRARDNYANGSLQLMAERTQGVTFQGKSVTFEADHAGLTEILAIMLNAEPVAGVITPGTMNYASNMPLTPVTVEANYPGTPTQVVDAQFNNLQIQMNPRANFGATLNFQAVKAVNLDTPAAAVLPVTGIYQSRDHYISYGAGEVQPEASSITLDVPIAAIDAARGNEPTEQNYILGFERSGPLQLAGQFSMPGVPQAFLDANRNGTFAPLEWTLVKYAADRVTVDREITFVVPNAEINTIDPGATLDRIVTPVTWTAVSLAGEPAFTVRIK